MNDTTEVTQEMLYQKPVRVMLSLLPGLLFLKPLLLESSRYILFGHLLLTESLQLFVTILLYVFAVTMVRMISYVCVVIRMLGVVTTKMSPLNLALMSLERYVAICFPLRHADIATTRRTGMAIAVIWTVASMDSFTQIVVFVSLDNKGSTVPTVCSRNSVLHLQIYSTIFTTFTIMCFVMVSTVIIYTYIAIMITVKSASSNSQNVTKAHRTVLLHLIQLCLCLSSTLFTMINPGGRWNMKRTVAIHIEYFLFLTLLILPKGLSPLIYGLRDQTLRHIFIHYFTFGLKTTCDEVCTDGLQIMKF
uniref:Odorant receptor, family 93, subfamily A, member 6 n=1 Tax=Scophthalmus maximus TaxID=52904 RepID=A0A8D3B4J0_SCOMX